MCIMATPSAASFGEYHVRVTSAQLPPDNKVGTIFTIGEPLVKELPVSDAQLSRFTDIVLVVLSCTGCTNVAAQVSAWGLRVLTYFGFVLHNAPSRLPVYRRW